MYKIEISEAIDQPRDELLVKVDTLTGIPGRPLGGCSGISAIGAHPVFLSLLGLVVRMIAPGGTVPRENAHWARSWEACTRSAQSGYIEPQTSPCLRNR
jgi:hypothetical protein